MHTTRAREDFSDVRRVGMDETSARKGQDYISLFADLDAGRVLLATEGQDADTPASAQAADAPARPEPADTPASAQAADVQIKTRGRSGRCTALESSTSAVGRQLRSSLSSCGAL
ncbi:hypothetical protein BH24ACT15_BH24ACT15_36990 [soil metagenome]